MSKACANAYTVYLAREYPQLVINACTPGFIETDMTRPYAERQNKEPADMGMTSPAEGARYTPSVSRYGFEAVGARNPITRSFTPGW